MTNLPVYDANALTEPYTGTPAWSPLVYAALPNVPTSA